MLERNPFVWSYYRLTNLDGRDLVECTRIDFLKGMIRNLPRGRYGVNQILTSSLPWGSTEKRWGAIVKLDDEKIVEEPDAWSPLYEPPIPATSRTSPASARSSIGMSPRDRCPGCAVLAPSERRRSMIPASTLADRVERTRGESRRLIGDRRKLLQDSRKYLEKARAVRAELRAELQQSMSLLYAVLTGNG
jgi:hypothetical protein